jgi:hypothetical protein
MRRAPTSRRASWRAPSPTTALIDPSQGNGEMVVAGVDWRAAQDANPLVLIAALADGNLNLQRHRSHVVYFIPYLEERFGMPYSQFVDRVVEVAERPLVQNVVALGPITRLGFFMRYVASERNGVGAMPTEVLARKMWEQRLHVGKVEGIHTDARRKQTAFGAIKLLLQQGRLVLPRHPELLRQLSSLEFETLDAGNLRIAVPEQRGHGDLAMALAQATSCLRIQQANRRDDPLHGSGEVLTTGSGTRIFERPRCSDNVRAFTSPRGASNEDDW